MAIQNSKFKIQNLWTLNEFDDVAVGVFDKGDDGAAVLHRARFAGHLAAVFTNPVACAGDVFGADGDVAETIAEVVLEVSQL